MDKFKNRISIENQKSLNNMINKAKELEKYNFILVDSVDKLKKLEFDDWYKSLTTGNQGIWVGNGITNQFALKLTKVSRDLYEDIENSFGYVIEKGTPTLIKLVEEGDIDE
jgi:S-DNA-T family DNA segregation ATPase FtsK/SpoIIIE